MAAAAGSGAKGAAKSPGAQALLRGVVFSTLAVSTGDYICQWIEDPSRWDRGRTLRMATATACVMSPASWLIVMRLERLFPGTSSRAVLAKTVANGLCAAPMISLNFAVITALEGNADPSSVFQHRVGTKLLPTMLNGILYWPFINALNFRFVRLENRPIVGACAGVLWNVYMSSVINAKQHHEHEQQELVAPLEEATAVSQPPLRQPQAQPLLAAVVEPATATAATAVAAAPPPQQQAEEGARVGSVGEKDGPAAAAVGGIWGRWAPAGALAFPASINIRFF